MIIAGKNILENLKKIYPETRGQVDAFLGELKSAKWNNPHDVKERFPAADNLGGKCYVFNIKGNHYRVVIKFDFIIQIARIRWAGSHKDYDKIKVKDELC